MSQAVSRRSVTAETWVRPHTIPCEKLGGEKWKREKVSAPVSGFSPVSIIPPLLHLHLHLNT